MAQETDRYESNMAAFDILFCCTRQTRFTNYGARQNISIKVKNIINFGTGCPAIRPVELCSKN